MKLEQAARQALEALESCEEDYIYDGENEYECDSIDWDKRNASITTLREALAEQAEQKPVAWGVFEGNLHDMFFEQSEAEYIAKCKGGDAIVKPLYAAPVRTKDLTDDEISKIWDDSSYGDSGIDFARAVIAADREKNK